MTSADAYAMLSCQKHMTAGARQFYDRPQSEALIGKFLFSRLLE